jgi:putative ABC transport system permease protein
MKLKTGRLLDESDERGAKSNVVVASQTAKDLFGDGDPIGKRISIGNGYFTIVGRLDESGSPILQQLSSLIVMPFSTAKALTGQTYLSFISLQSSGDSELAKQDLVSLLRQRHHIRNPENDPEKDDFDVRSTQQAETIIGTVTFGLTVFLSLIAGISLVVGGVGIMNIMLVSVMERTREIGLRKAVGARGRDILLQFLFEALTLTLVGGVLGLLSGVALGWFFIFVASKLLGSIVFVLSWTAVFTSLSMAFLTGLIFGIVPAKNAAQLNPIEALRYE